MAETKYGFLVKKLDFQTDTAGTKGFWLMGKDMAGLNLNLAFAYTDRVGTWRGEGSDGHVHSYGECLVFTGFDYDHPNDLGAEIEIALGEEGERHAFNTTTAVALPPGMPHNPIITRKAEKLYGFMAISLNPENEPVDLPERTRQSSETIKYRNLVKSLDMRDIHRTSGGNADIIAGWNGKDLSGLNLNFTWAFHKGTGAWHDKDPHVHPNDEVLLFIGSDPTRPEYLGAEIEIAMGEELEKHVFDTPTLVVAPKGLVHCPLVTRRVDYPYCFSAICLNNEHATTWLGGK